MNTTDVVLLSVLGLSLVLAAFLALAEASLLRITEFRARALAEAGNAPAQRLTQLLERLSEVLNLILLLALLSQIGAATITGFLAQRWFGTFGVTAASVLLTAVLFVYGEAIPKTYAVRHAERTSLLVAGPISVLERFLRPLVSALVWVSDIQLPGKGITTSPRVTEAELRLMAGDAAHEGEITQEDRELIERVFRFGDRKAEDIMVPRPDIVAVPVTATVEEALEVSLTSGHRRIPVFSGTLENVIGVVRLRDLIDMRHRQREDLSEIMGDPLATPESKPLASLLSDMQEEKTHLAIVVDEYGVTAGLVTVEDIAGALIGTISHGEEPSSITQVAVDQWEAAGSLPVDALAELDVELPEGDWNTVAGLMIGQAGRLLRPGEEIEVDSLRLRVDKVQGRRIMKVSIFVSRPPSS